jgi:hypothetical protein
MPTKSIGILVVFPNKRLKKKVTKIASYQFAQVASSKNCLHLTSIQKS